MDRQNVNVMVGGPINENYPRKYKTKYIKPTISLSGQITESDTKYIIRHNYDLGGEEIIIPERCIVEFDGGSIKNGKVLLSSNVTINGNKTVFVVPPHTQVICAENSTGIRIYNCVFDCTNNAHRSYEYGGVFLKGCSDVIVKGCKFFGKEDGSSGRMGLAMFKCDDVVIEDNDFSYFYDPNFWQSGSGKPTSWATYFVSLKNAVVINNRFVKTYSGIKFTGWIENIQVTDNYSVDSVSDGLDFAGISALNVSICNNTFIRNNDNGVEFKILEVDGANYDNTLHYYGYSMDTPRYFKNITIANNTFIGHRGLSMVNAFTKMQENALLVTEKPYMFDDDNIGNISVANNVMDYFPSDMPIPNPNSSFGVFIILAATPQQNIVFDSNVVSGNFGLYVVSSTNLVFSKNAVNSVNTAIYFRRQPNRILSYDNIFDSNHLVTKNGPYIGIKEDELDGSAEAHHNIFNNNRFLKVFFNKFALMPEIPVYNQFTNNEFGKAWVSIDRRFVKENDSPCSVPTSGSTFYRENGLVEGFSYYNTENNCLDILKIVGKPVFIRFRIAKLPTRPGYITFSWVVDAIKREEGQNPSVTVVIDKVPASNAEFANLIAEQVNMSRWYFDMDDEPTAQWITGFKSKENYAYSLPPAPRYETDTGAEFVPSYINGENEEWLSIG